MNKVLVTGAAGYIGSVLVRELIKEGYLVRGMDMLAFGDSSIKELLGNKRFDFVKADICDQMALKKCIESVDAVVHLAAIVGDPACANDPGLAKRVNLDASNLLLDACIDSGKVKRFVFASTCSNYGKSKTGGLINEGSELNPVSIYAKLKIEFERRLLGDDELGELSPICLRFATAFGLSPRMRFDLTVNEFVSDAFIKKELVVYGEEFWRPYCHVRDISRACMLALRSPKELVDRGVFGVGDTNENYQKKALAHMAEELIPGTKVRYVYKKEDPRDYKVDFSKIQKQLGFLVTKNVSDGMREIYEALKEGVFPNPLSSNFRNT